MSASVVSPTGGRTELGDAIVQSTPLPRRPPHGPSATTKRDDWPHTNRIMPWALAVFIAILWLVPFDQIVLLVSLPFQLKPDRIILPMIAALWLVARAVGGVNRPRVRLTPIHVAVGLYVAVAFASVVVNVGWLNTTLLFSSSLKQLILLSAYALLFVMVASVIRPSEVRAFVKYTLILAVICSIGSLWEYRTHYAVFYEWVSALLPHGVFFLPMPDTTAVDELGRHSLFGPTSGPLELAVMMSLALPIAVLGLTRATRRRDYFLYALATCLFVAADLATYRKSSLILPLVVAAFLIWGRPKRLRRLLPILPVMAIAIHLLAPQAFGSVVAELSPQKAAAVSSTTHRDDGYDEVRPVIWSKPLLGQGFGSYNGNLNRIYDSQILDTLVETGALGLMSYLGMIITVIVCARSMIRKRVREPDVARYALIFGTGAAVFLVASFLYDAMTFPHGPYLFFVYAGLAAVLMQRSSQSDPTLPVRQRWERKRRPDL